MRISIPIILLPSAVTGKEGGELEEALIAQARKGDLKSFSALVEIYQERALHVACSFLGNEEDARDVAQEAFVKAYENLSSFRDNSRFYTWFYRLLVNHCKDFIRKKTRRREVVDPPVFENLTASSRGPREEAVNQELKQEIYTALDSLPFQQRSVFTLRYLEGLSLEEIAETLVLSVGGVKSNLWQAAQKMQKYLANYSPDRRDS